MKKLLFILFAFLIIFASCSKTYIVYCKGGKKVYTKTYSYSRGVPEFYINALDVDSVRVKGDTTRTEYKFK